MLPRPGPRRPLAALTASLLAALATLPGACVTTGEPALPDPVVGHGVERIELPLSLNRKLDLLFVIDSSPAMAPHRARLLDAYRRTFEALEAGPRGLPDLHIGVVTTDLGTRGGHDNTAGATIGAGPGSCTPEGDRGELRRVPAIAGDFLVVRGRPDGTRERNYEGSLADAFEQLADVGAEGCVYTRPLEAMRRVLAIPPGAGTFLREHARLIVVFLTADDDCSFASSAFPGGDLDRSRCAASPVGLVGIDEYVAALGQRGIASLGLLGGFVPPGAPGCADARPAPRLAAFFDRFGPLAQTGSLCAPDLEGVLDSITRLELTTLLGDPCFASPLHDLDPIADGLQGDCASWFSYLDGGQLVEERIPACAGDPTSTCFEIVHDPVACIGPGYSPRLRHPRYTFDTSTEARAIIECVSR